MEKSNSISNIPKTNTKYNNFYYNKYKTKPPTILKKLDTNSLCPFLAASITGETPLLSEIFTSALLVSSVLTMPK